MGKVTVVGSYIVALVIDTDRIPLEGETVVGRNYHRTPGGRGSNMAAASRLGAQTAFLGKIGRDSDVVLSPLEIPLATALCAVRIAKAQSVRAILNPAPAVICAGVTCLTSTC